MRKQKGHFTEWSAPFRLDWLPGQDSNLRPAGYKCPDFSTGLGLSLHPSTKSRGGCRALVRRYWTGSAASSLCTVLPTRWPFGRLRSGFPFRFILESGQASLNSPEVSTTVSRGGCSEEWTSLWQFAQRSRHLSNSTRIFSQLRVYPLLEIPKSFSLEVRWWNSNASIHRS